MLWERGTKVEGSWVMGHVGPPVKAVRLPMLATMSFQAATTRSASGGDLAFRHMSASIFRPGNGHTGLGSVTIPSTPLPDVKGASA